MEYTGFEGFEKSFSRLCAQRFSIRIQVRKPGPEEFKSSVRFTSFAL